MTLVAICLVIPQHMRLSGTVTDRLPMGGPWWPCVYLALLQRYGASKIMGSRPWSFGVTWHH